MAMQFPKGKFISLVKVGEKGQIVIPKGAATTFSRMMLYLFPPEKFTVRLFTIKTLTSELSFTFPKDIWMVTGQILMIYPNVFPKRIKNNRMFYVFRLLLQVNSDRLLENLNIRSTQRNMQMSCITTSFF